MEGNSNNNFRQVINGAKKVVKTTMKIITKPFLIIALGHKECG